MPTENSVWSFKSFPTAHVTTLHGLLAKVPALNLGLVFVILKLLARDDIFANHSLTPSESAYFADSFDEGAVVLVVHAHKAEQRNVATRLLRRHGGLFAVAAASALPMENRGVL